jgi:hypothetical protein
VRGPHCLYSTTLPATLRLTDAGPGKTLLAKALVPDPCYWSPELPFLYDVHVELKQGGDVIATADRLLGLRDFGPRGRFFYNQGKRRVIRATNSVHPDYDMLAWHDTPLDLFLSNPSDAVCEEASRTGVMILASPGSVNDGHDVRQQVRRLARHAAVAIVGLSADELPLLPELRQLAPNLVYASDDCQGDLAADCIASTVFDSEGFARQFATRDVPVIALTRVDIQGPPDALRAACDGLQAQLAPRGDFAGYAVINMLGKHSSHG